MNLDTEKETERRFIAVAEESLKEYKRTGEHVTLDEFSAWVGELKSNPKTPIPLVHT